MISAARLEPALEVSSVAAIVQYTRGRTGVSYLRGSSLKPVADGKLATIDVTCPDPGSRAA